ncbi:hypothetical protein BH24ACT22_BH24ACT22_14720 [soil metagenome]
MVDLRRHDGTMCEGPEVSHCIRCIASRNPNPRVRWAVGVPGVIPKLAGRLSRTPLVRYSGALRQVRDVRERPAYVREKMQSVDHVLAYTHLTRDLLQTNGLGAGKTSVSPYGIDVSDAAPARERRQPSPTLRVGFVGTLAPHKGPDLPVRAFRAAPDLDATLAVYGNSEGYEDYAEELRSLAGDDRRVEFRGTFSLEELGSVFSEIDMLVVPSRWYENAPGVIFEAFAAGVPVIATNLGGMSEFVRPEENGLLFGLEDVEGLACQLNRLAGEPGLLERLREGIPSVKTVGEYVDEVEELYDTLLKEQTW